MAKTQRLHRLTGIVLDASTGRPIASRLYLQGADGTWHFPRAATDGGTALPYKKQFASNLASVEMHTILSAHPWEIDLAEGAYILAVERGKEYLPSIQQIRVGPQTPRVRTELRRWIDMAAKGWYSGDTHCHRSTYEMPVLIDAEDLNVGFPMVHWVKQAGVAPSSVYPKQLEPVKPIYVDPTHVFWPLNTEYEIFSVGEKRHTLGAIMVINQKAPMTTAAPPVGPVAAEARKQGALLELDKHNWEWSMAVASTTDVDLYELSNNHMWRTEFGVKNWGMPAAPYMNIERDANGWTENGWIDYTLQNYYALLNAGLRPRPTAGTANGVHPVPLGFGRVYVHITEKFTYERWLNGLNARSSFVTTGPMLLATVDEKYPGYEITLGPEGGSVRFQGSVHSIGAIDRIEVLLNGQVAAGAKPENLLAEASTHLCRFDERVSVATSGWVAVRCYERFGEARFRYAHTAPVYITVPGKPYIPRKVEMEYLAQRVRDEIARSQELLPEAAVEEYRAALARYESLARIGT